MFGAIISFISTLIDLRSWSEEFKDWWKKRSELKESISLLRSSRYFMGHIVHVGGEFSMVYSIRLYVNEGGGYYLNPPENFVNISFNRGGDFMVVQASDFSEEAGFRVDSYGLTEDVVVRNNDHQLCHLPTLEMRNEYYVKFIRTEHGLRN